MEEEKKFIEDSDGSSVSREKWDNKLQSFLTMMGFIVGVGNLWRFPYMCMKNGGGAFLVPFILSGIFLAYPIFLIEVALGQFTAKAIHKCWEACPLLKGIGYGMLISLFICVYYVMVVTWPIYYIGSSFTSPLKWSTCNNWWNTENCIIGGASPRNSSNVTSHLVKANTSIASYFSSSTEEYFEHKVLQISSGIEDVGGFNIPLLLCQAGSWIIIFLCIMKGVRSIGKVVYVTATLPVLLIIILLIRNAIEPGAVDGILMFLIPDMTKLRDVNVWIEAALQIFYSSGVLWGPIITIQGFNKFKNNCVRDAALVLCAGEGTSILAGFLVFSVLGSMAHQRGVTIQEVAKSGPGLAFIVYPEAVSKLPLPNLWAVLFFLMLFTLALDSTFGTYEPIIIAVTDSFKLARQNRVKTALLVVFLLFLFSIPFTLKSGFYNFQLLDWYIVSISFPVFGITYCFIFGWIYGADRFCRDIEMMTDRPVPLFIRFCWCIITPIGMILLLVSVIVLYEPPSYGNYEYPVAATTCGFIIASLPIIPIPVMAIYQIRKAEGCTFIEKLRNAVKPSVDWRPGSQDMIIKYEKANERNTTTNLLEYIRLNLLGR